MAAKKAASAKKRNPKGYSAKKVEAAVYQGDGWNVVWGKLRPRPGRPKKVKPLFKVVAEKLPFHSLRAVRTQLKEEGISGYGVYMAHDSMGVARYAGRGSIFHRLYAHQKNYPRELIYFSFFIIEEKAHEREIETAILRATGSQMLLNTRKVRTGIEVGNVGDYEPGTLFFERQKQKGR
ncbi:MAG: hypothetical protein ACFCUT_17420 [Kiloniellaceae bacterium]